MAGVVFAEIALIAMVRRSPEQLAGLRAFRDHEERALRGFDFHFDYVKELVEVAGHHVRDGFGFREERMAVRNGDGELCVRTRVRIEMAYHDGETIFFIEDETGDLEKFVGHLALLHRTAEQFEFGVVREKGASDHWAEGGCFVLPARGSTRVALAIVTTRAAGSIAAGAARTTGSVTTRAATLSIAGRAATVAARAITETRAIAITAGGTAAGAYLLRRAADPLGAKTKRGEVQFEGLFLRRVVFGRVGGH
jgi:hypothetical protein